MSYDIYLVDPETKETIYFDEPHDLKGGTYAIGGTTEAWLNITYNYFKFFRQYVDPEKGIRALYGKPAKDCIPILLNAIDQLGTHRDEDYWAATPGNAGAALENLLMLCRLAPEAIVTGD